MQPRGHTSLQAHCISRSKLNAHLTNSHHDYMQTDNAYPFSYTSACRYADTHYIPSPFDVVDTTPKTQKSIQKSIEIG